MYHAGMLSMVASAQEMKVSDQGKQPWTREYTCIKKLKSLADLHKQIKTISCMH